MAPYSITRQNASTLSKLHSVMIDFIRLFHSCFQISSFGFNSPLTDSDSNCSIDFHFWPTSFAIFGGIFLVKFDEFSVQISTVFFLVVESIFFIEYLVGIVWQIKRQIGWFIYFFEEGNKNSRFRFETVVYFQAFILSSLDPFFYYYYHFFFLVLALVLLSGDRGQGSRGFGEEQQDEAREIHRTFPNGLTDAAGGWRLETVTNSLLLSSISND